jgi:hypothetical protein
MNKSYRLYKIRFANGIMVQKYINTVWAENMIEAEFQLQQHMEGGGEYLITVTG